MLPFHIFDRCIVCNHIYEHVPYADRIEMKSSTSFKEGKGFCVIFQQEQIYDWLKGITVSFSFLGFQTCWPIFTSELLGKGISIMRNIVPLGSETIGEEVSSPRLYDCHYFVNLKDFLRQTSSIQNLFFTNGFDCSPLSYTLDSDLYLDIDERGNEATQLLQLQDPSWMTLIEIGLIGRYTYSTTSKTREKKRHMAKRNKNEKSDSEKEDSSQKRDGNGNFSFATSLPSGWLLAWRC